MTRKPERFTKVPNKFIRGNIKKEFGISRKFYITYILIDKYRSYENYSWITIRKILDFYGYKTTKNKPKAVYEILDVLEFMINNGMIEVKQDLNSLSYDTGIEIKVIPENFDSESNFTKITSSQLDIIMEAGSSLNKENVLVAFLYIISYIGCRKRKSDGSEYEDANQNPEAFYRSIKHMSTDLSMSKDTINKCIEYLTRSSKTRNALLIKREVSNIQPDNSKPSQNVPNIYVLNKDGYEQELEWAIKKVFNLYKEDM